MRRASRLPHVCLIREEISKWSGGPISTDPIIPPQIAVKVTCLSQESTFVCQLFGVFGLHFTQAATPKLTTCIPNYLHSYYPQHDRFLHRNGAYIREMHKYLDES